MTLYEFNTLPMDGKANAVWNGTFIMHRQKSGSKYSLYSISGFFVEVSYDHIKNEITNFRSFRTKRLLENYLNEIDITI